MGTIHDLHDYYPLKSITQNIDFTYFAYHLFRLFDQIKYFCHTGKYDFNFSMHSNSSPKKKAVQIVRYGIPPKYAWTVLSLLPGPT
jgi:hypothetical protein